MGDVRFAAQYERLRRSADRVAALREMEDDAVIAALAASGRDADPYLANVLATEAHNRVLSTARALEQIEEGVLILDPRGVILRVNAPAQRILGWTAAELVGTPVSALFVRAERADELVRSALEHKRPVDASDELLIASDRTVAARITASTLMRDGVALGSVVAFVDLSGYLAADRMRGLGPIVSRILADQFILSEAAPRVLAAIGKRLGWNAGALWILEANAGEHLHCLHYWATNERARAFEEVTRGLPVDPETTLPGKVWGAGRAMWFSDLREQGWFARADAARAAGLCAAFAVPIRASGRVVGVFEFFHRDVLEQDDDLLRTMEVVAGLLGQFVERSRLAGQNALLLAVLDAMDDGYVLVGADGTVTLANVHAVELFGRAASAVRGVRVDDLVGGRGGSSIAEALRPIFEGGSLDEMEGEVTHEGGPASHLRLSARPVRGPGGDVAAVALTLRRAGADASPPRAGERVGHPR